MGDYTHCLALALARIPNVRVGLLTSRAASALDSQGLIDVFAVIGVWDWRDLKAIRAVIGTWAPDVVHIQYPTLGYGRSALPWLLPLLLRLARVSIVQTWHEVYSPRTLIKFRMLFKFLSQAVVPGELIVVRKELQDNTHAMLRWIYRNKNVEFIPNASSIPAVELTVAQRQAIRAKYARPDARIVAYFGFIAPHKQIERLFEIARPEESHLVIVGDTFRERDLQSFSQLFDKMAAYHESLLRLANSDQWKGKVTMTGFLPASEAAAVLAAADAVVLPFQQGIGEWSTTMHAAQAQGTFVLTTSSRRRGYDPVENVYFANPDDAQDMRQALEHYAGRRSGRGDLALRAWQCISESHLKVYNRVSKRSCRNEETALHLNE